MADNFSLPNAQIPYPTNVTPLSDVMNSYANAARSQLSLQKERATLQPDIERAQAESRGAQANANTAETTAASNKWKLTVAQEVQFAQIGSTLNQDPDFLAATDAIKQASDAQKKMPMNRQGMPDPYSEAVDKYSPVIVNKLIEAKKLAIQQGVPEAIAEANTAHMIGLAVTHPERVGDTLNALLRSGMSAENQNATQYPAPVLVNEGKTATPRSMGNVRNTGVLVGTQEGPSISLTLPPGGRYHDQPYPNGKIYRQNTDDNGNPVGTPFELQTTEAPSGKGQPSTPEIQGTTALITSHGNYQDAARAAANDSQTRITSLDNIIETARKNPKIFADAPIFPTLRKYVYGLFGAGSENLTDQQVVDKYTAFLQQGGRTDAADALRGASTPGAKMTPEAVLGVASALKSIESMKVDGAKIFSNLTKGSPEFTKAQNTWQANADPRVWEMSKASPGERAKLIQKMTPAQKEAIKNKTLQLRSVGVDV